MSETGDASKPGLPDRLLPLGDRGKVNLIDRKRVYDADSIYPDWSAATGAPTKPYFRIDSYLLTHQLQAPKNAGQTSKPMVREVFERGDAVGVFLYHRDRRSVIVVRQFRLPTLSRPEAGADGWIHETVAGEVRPKKGGPERTREQVAIDETKEETGYKINNPELIATFYSSPGGTSEKIYLYFAEVSTADEGEPTGQDATEDIVVEEWPLETLAKKLRDRELVDPKLVIAGYYLPARLGMQIETKTRLKDGEAREVYVHKAYPKLEIRIKTGDILNVRDVDVWLNPENKYMLMARVIDAGISASIRWGGAEKYNSGIVSFDTIGNELRQKMQGRTEASNREIIETSPGALTKAYNVRRLLHLSIACQRRKEAGRPIEDGRERLAVDVHDVAPTVSRALKEVHLGNASVERWAARVRDRLNGYSEPCRSVLVPLIGTGEGGLSLRQAVPEILAGIVEFAATFGAVTEVTTIHLLAYYDRDMAMCVSELEKSGFKARPGEPRWT